MESVYDNEKTPMRTLARPPKRRRARPPSKVGREAPAKVESVPREVKKAPAEQANGATHRAPSRAHTRTRDAGARGRTNPRPRPPPTPIAPEPKVELDPVLRQEIAAMESRPGRMVRLPRIPAEALVGDRSSLAAGRRHDSDEVTTPPMTDARRPLREVRGRSLFRQEGEQTKLFREVEAAQEPCTEELDLNDIVIEDDVELTPQVLELREDKQGVAELDDEDLTELDGVEMELSRPIPSGGKEEVTPLLPLGDESGITPLPDVMQMEELDALLRELLSSVGVLVSMLEERIDSAGGACREHGQLARMVAREAGMDELSISRAALAAYLYALDLTLRNEVGEPGPGDVAAAFCMDSGSTGGLGPSLRMLGARALGLSDEGGGAATPGVRLVRLVAQFLSLRAQSGDQGTDLGTVIQLLKAGGADATLVDALTRAMESSQQTMVMRIPPRFLD